MHRRLILHLFFFCIILPASGQMSLVDSIINATDAKMLVEWLASDSFSGRFSGSKDAARAADFIAGEFEKAGIRPISGNKGYFMPFYIGRVPPQYRIGLNVMGAKAGNAKADELIIFSAHYDHVGTSSTNKYVTQNNAETVTKDTIYNGANDNASGVAAVILLARYFMALNQNNRTILFIAFSGEELGLLGSMVLAEIIDKKSIAAMINIDMIGRGRGQHARPIITGASYSNLQVLLNGDLQKVNQAKYGKNYFGKDQYMSQNLFGRSDNWSFATKGVPAHTVMLTDPTDKYYHSPNDEVSTLDFNAMTKVIQAIALSAESLIAGSATPTRVKL